MGQDIRDNVPMLDRRDRRGIIVAIKLATFLIINRNNICYFKSIGEYTCCKRSTDHVTRTS